MSKKISNNFKFNKKNIGKIIEIKGWVNKSRRLGDLIFIDLRNDNKIVQAVVSLNSNAYDEAKKIRSEFVISLKGEIVERKNKNTLIENGDIEIKVFELEIINKSKQTPMIIRDKTDALEQKRMEYRYLDLRRPKNYNMLINRSKFNKIIRDYFYDLNFIEVETPIITKPTIGGSGELKVLSQNHKGKYYSLAQSPQLYKQLLMYSGINKYFQIVRCFRDEDSRSDRQLEFTQLDIEINFTNESKIRDYINNLLTKIVKEFRNINKLNFPVLTYDEAIFKYGSDKPDLRFENKIYDLTNFLKETSINFIKEGIKKGKKVKSIFFEGDLSNSKIKKIEETIKSQSSLRLFWLKIKNEELLGTLKNISLKEVKLIKKIIKINNDGILFLILDDEKISLEFIGRVRLMVAKELNIINKNELSFVWITKFPLFEINNEKNIESMHNPFTSVSFEDLEKFRKITKDNKKELLNIRSNAYDIVLNGSEIGGGAIRFSNKEDQYKVFKLIGFSEKEIELNFGWFLEAQNYGIPNHGGIALGLDRLLCILLGKKTIRDVIAFPKSTSGADEMMKAPIELKKKIWIKE